MTQNGSINSCIFGEFSNLFLTISTSTNENLFFTVIQIVDIKTREVLGPNQHGEVCIRGPVLMSGYIGVDPATYLDEEGFFKTGDLGYYDEDEHVYIIDRIKEFITSLGYKVMTMDIDWVIF